MLNGRGGFALVGVALALVLAGCASQEPTEVMNDGPSLAKGGRAGDVGTVYVSSQGLYYDTFATADPLPMHGRFQQLAEGVTEFGPGDPGYLGGRWWVDVNGNHIQDSGDHFFLCPLLPPGRATP